MRLTTPLLGCLLLLTPGLAQDADVAPVESTTPPLARITVSAARAPRPDLDVPSSVTVLDADQIRLRRSERSFTAVLDQVPGVSAQETAAGQGSPFVRALTGQRVLTTVDGVRLNGSYFRAGPNQYLASIDPFMIGTIEVLRGQGSVLYGSDALGGVLAVRSRDPLPPPDHEPGESWVRVGGALRYAQPLREGAEAAVTPRLDVMAGAGPVSVIGGFDYVHVGDRETGEHMKTARNSAYSAWNGDLKLLYQPTDHETVTVAFQRSELRNVPRTHSTVFADPWRGLSVGNDLRRDLDQSRQLTYLQIESRDRGPFARAKANVSLQRTYENQDRLRTSGPTRTGFEIYTLGTFVELENDLPVDAVDATVSYGIDYYHDFIDSFETDRGFRRPRGALADDAHYDLFGTYLQLEVRAGVVDFVAGMRYSLARIYARDVDPDPTDTFPFGRVVETYDAILGSGGVVVHLLPDELSLVGSISQGFRAPNVSDVTAFEAVRSTSFDSPSPGLKEERTLTLEAGLKFNWPFLRGQVFYAYSFLYDFIQRVPTGNTVQTLAEFTKQNIGRGSIQAVDFQLELLFDPMFAMLGSELPPLGFSILSRFSWARGYIDTFQPATGDTTKDHLTRVPPTRFACALRWTEPEQERFWAEVEAVFVREVNRLAPNDLGDTQRIPPGGSPSYSLWHIRAGVNLLDERIKGSIGLENVLDNDYRIHGSGTNGYGRTLVVSLEALW